MTIHSLFGDITNEIIDYIYNQSRKRKNKAKLKYIIDTCTDIAFKDVKPYLYTILIILMFLTNCWTFYYYIKLFYSITHLPKNMNF